MSRRWLVVERFGHHTEPVARYRTHWRAERRRRREEHAVETARLSRVVTADLSYRIERVSEVDDA